MTVIVTIPPEGCSGSVNTGCVDSGCVNPGCANAGYVSSGCVNPGCTNAGYANPGCMNPVCPNPGMFYPAAYGDMLPVHSQQEAVMFAKNSMIVHQQIATACKIKGYYPPVWDRESVFQCQDCWFMELTGMMSGFVDTYAQKVCTRRFRAFVYVYPNGAIRASVSDR